jgi:hypothetical protein
MMRGRLAGVGDLPGTAKTFVGQTDRSKFAVPRLKSGGYRRLKKYPYPPMNQTGRWRD